MSLFCQRFSLFIYLFIYLFIDLFIYLIYLLFVLLICFIYCLFNISFSRYLRPSLEIMILSEVLSTNCLNASNVVTIMGLIQSSPQLFEHQTLIALCKVCFPINFFIHD
jgi:ABC-type protease/lipase transport system fused ATPase/permease subunit